MSLISESPPLAALEPQLKVAGLNTYADYQNSTVYEVLVHRLAKSLDSQGHLRHWPEAFPVGEVESFINADAYQAEIQARARLLWRYRHLGFDAVVGAAVSEAAQPLGTGNHSTTYPLDHLGMQFAVRVPDDNPAGERVVAISKYAHDLWIGNGVSRLEQLATYDLLDGFTVSLRGPERFLYHPDNLAAITDDQLGDLRETIVALWDMRRWAGMNRADVLYGKDVGFVIIDYTETGGSVKLRDRLYEPVEFFFPRSLFYEVEQSSGDAEFDALESRSMVAAADLAWRYIRICEEHHPDIQIPEYTKWGIKNAEAIHRKRLRLLTNGL